MAIMRYKKIVLSIIASVLCLGILSGCGHKNEISIKIETYLQEKYGEEFEVLSWNQRKLLPTRQWCNLCDLYFQKLRPKASI